MQSLRQLGGGVIVALISVLLVIGGISLALAETLPSQATPTPIPPTLSLEFPTATFTASPLILESPTPLITTTPFVFATDTAFATNTLFVQASCNPPSAWQRILTTASDTIYSLAQRYKTTAENLGSANCLSSFDVPAGFALYVPPVPTVTVIPCGPPAGYVKRHVVQPGDNLYRIALSYGITYPQLQRANCMGSSTTIYAGQRLWVPNIPTRTPVPGVTIIPTFTTATASNTPVTPVPQYP
ncbi:MAG TPA: LysM peptidoglycan-binding domain-containing protein [Anaerolineales bacterium]|nr:LysM peptidoglycan-binding domain-containing protein [Anaerolineales bacterium]